MQKKIVVTASDYQRLVGLIEFASLKTKMPELVSRLYQNLQAAKMLPQEDIDKSIVTMNSRVLLKDLTRGLETELTITYPQDADSSGKRVSVFSNVGIALLGRREKDVVSWKVPSGVGFFEIAQVTYQPEAAGDYFL